MRVREKRAPHEITGYTASDGRTKSDRLTLSSRRGVGARLARHAHELARGRCVDSIRAWGERGILPRGRGVGVLGVQPRDLQRRDRSATRLWLLAAKSQAANLLREEENLVEFSYLVWTLLFARTLILRAEACDAERDVDDRETERDREILPKQWGGADGVEVLHPT